MLSPKVPALRTNSDGSGVEQLVLGGHFEAGCGVTSCGMWDTAEEDCKCPASPESAPAGAGPASLVEPSSVVRQPLPMGLEECQHAPDQAEDDHDAMYSPQPLSPQPRQPHPLAAVCCILAPAS